MPVMVGLGEHLEVKHENAAPVGGFYGPGVIVPGMAAFGGETMLRWAEAEEVSGAEDPAAAFVEGAGTGVNLEVFGAFGGEIDFEAEVEAQGGECPCRRGCNSPHLMIGYAGNVGAHGFRGKEEAGAELNTQALDGVGLVAGPELGHVGEESEVEAAAAAGAALEEDAGKAPGEGGDEAVEAEHIAVGGIRAVGFHDGPVHVPFHIADGCGGEKIGEQLQEIVHHFGQGEVQNQLISGEQGFSAFTAAPAARTVPAAACAPVSRTVPAAPPAPAFIPAFTAPPAPQHPLGMPPIKLTLGIHHLGLHPDAEIQPRLPNLRRSRLQPPGEFPLIGLPVAQSPAIVPAIREPSVVHHQNLPADFLPPAGQLHHLIVVHIEVMRLPGVDHNRPVPLPPLLGEDVSPQKPMIGIGHPGEPPITPGQGRRRGIETLPGPEPPGKPLRINPALQPLKPELIPLRQMAMIPAVEQRRPRRDPVHLPGPGLHQGGERRMLMGRHPAPALHRPPARAHPAPGDMPLPRPGPVQSHHIRLLHEQIQGCRSRMLDKNIPPGFVSHPNPSQYHRQIRNRQIMEIRP